MANFVKSKQRGTKEKEEKLAHSSLSLLGTGIALYSLLSHLIYLSRRSRHFQTCMLFGLSVQSKDKPHYSQASHLHTTISFLLSARILHPGAPSFTNFSSGFSAMATLALAMLILAMAGRSSATWCVCKDGVADTTLQKALDYACGAGADCNPIRQNAGCFLPNTVKAHCSYAVNSYFQKKGQSQGSCDFAGVATISTSDPSTAGCSYPSSAGGGGTGSMPVTTTPVTTPPAVTTPGIATPGTTIPGTTTPATRTPSTTTTATPYNATPTGVLGGAGAGVSPSGAGITTDESHGGLRLQHCISLSLLSILLSGFTLWWV